MTVEAEGRGTSLASEIVARLASSGISSTGESGPPDGPHFVYNDGPVLFSRREGTGPLDVAWDTNLLIDYFEFGALLWEGEPLPDSLSIDRQAELEGLQIVMTLWVLRDIRFHILPGVVDDTRRKPLTPEHKRQRLIAWQEFCAALDLAADWEEPLTPTRNHEHNAVDEALQQVPAGNDRGLVRDAVARNMHVFMTCDKKILRARETMSRIGILVASPLDLLEELAAVGALHCLLSPSYLHWPMPDQQRVSHLIAALGAPED